LIQGMVIAPIVAAVAAPLCATAPNRPDPTVAA
jgi:hypothetical protein